MEKPSPPMDTIEKPRITIRLREPTFSPPKQTGKLDRIIEKLRRSRDRSSPARESPRKGAQTKAVRRTQRKKNTEKEESESESDFSSSESEDEVRKDNLKTLWANAMMEDDSEDSSDDSFRPDEETDEKESSGRQEKVGNLEAMLAESDDSSDESFAPDDGDDEGKKGNVGEEEDKDDVEDEDEEGDSVGMTLGDLIHAIKSESKKKGEHNDEKNDKMYCGVCLCDDSNEDDGEIMQCDNCGVTVHEACFGITDNDSEKSNSSEFSTEPWFCDACKANETPVCSLCCSKDGLFKETDDSRWVHAVCALYTNDVQFGSVDTLSPVIITRIPANRWNSKTCDLCTDEETSQKGICIRCDAGLCKKHFHVTCAQRNGFLKESPPGEMVADPFYAYCKQHCNKDLARVNRKVYQSVMQRMKTFRDKRTHNQNERVLGRLMKARVDYEHLKANPKEIVPLKAETEATVDPALDFRFVWNYYERMSLIAKLEANWQFLTKRHEQMKEEEKVLKEKGNELSSQVNQLQGDSVSLWKAGRELWMKLNSVRSEELPFPKELVREPRETIQLEELLQKIEKSVRKRKSAQPNEAAVRAPSDARCCVCESADDSHLLVDCDTCHDWYHLECLDPPMKKMPKKSSRMGWECHFCTDKADNAILQPSSAVADSKQTSSKRGRTIKNPDKFQFSPSARRKREAERADKDKARRTLFNMFRRKRGRKKKEETGLNPPAKKRKDRRTECSKCGKGGNNQTLVRCDDCYQCYHFSCLEPPRKTNPKVSGYKWFCVSCIPSSEEEDNSWELLDKAEKLWKKRNPTGSDVSSGGEEVLF
eukprot:m.17885 g.17885  ORF g.17885 m.17885 type:complete len:820 (+) comp27563_c0_seq5:63-2522(+)